MRFYFDVIHSPDTIISPSLDSSGKDYPGLLDYLIGEWGDCQCEQIKCPPSFKDELHTLADDEPDCFVFRVKNNKPPYNTFWLFVWSELQYDSYLLTNLKYHSNQIDKYIQLQKKVIERKKQ